MVMAECNRATNAGTLDEFKAAHLTKITDITCVENVRERTQCLHGCS